MKNTHLYCFKYPLSFVNLPFEANGKRWTWMITLENALLTLSLACCICKCRACPCPVTCYGNRRAQAQLMLIGPAHSVQWGLCVGWDSMYLLSRVILLMCSSLPVHHGKYSETISLASFNLFFSYSVQEKFRNSSGPWNWDGEEFCVY